MLYSLPENYSCPICPALRGVDDESTWIKQEDFVFRDDMVAAFIGSKFVKNNPGYPLVVPVRHVPNLYELPAEIGHAIMDITRTIALALKEIYQCDGVTVIQNNEPVGWQHAFHYHTHVIPRFEEDELEKHLLSARKSEPAERLPFAEALRRFL